MPLNGLGKLQAGIFAISLVQFLLSSPGFSDTFTHLQNKEVLHGYSTGLTEREKTVVHTQEKGLVKLNLSEWIVSADRLGRNNQVIVITLEGPIMHEIETAAFGQAIAEALQEGPLFILLRIDTPGGRIDYAQRICGAISRASPCPVIAFVRGGEYGGAVSAGAAAAFACNRIYMTNDTVIGAAATVTISDAGRPQTLAKAYDDEVAEKFNSVWRAYLASLAERNYRPGLLARAMVDSDTEVIEVSDAGKRLFIDPIDKKSEQQLVRTWNKKGSLLTLTSMEAVDCVIADKVVESQQDVLSDLNARGAKIIINETVQNAAIELKRARGQLNRIRKSIDLKIKQAKEPMPAPKMLNILRGARSEFQTLVKLAKKYPDLRLDVKILEDELNSIEANYQRLRMDSNQQ